MLTRTVGSATMEEVDTERVSVGIESRRRVEEDPKTLNRIFVNVAKCTFVSVL